MKGKTTARSFTRLEVSKDRVIRDLRKIGVKEGDHIAVALSFKSIGYVKGGPEAFIDALLEAVGPNGTIMMNTFTKSFPTSEIASHYIFDYRSTPARTGLVPETLRKRRNSIRSRHPTNSVTAVGKIAKYLTEGHDGNSGAYAPYSRLAKAGGKMLCIGIGNRLVAIRHEAQHLAGLLSIVPLRCGVKYRDNDGTVRICVRRDVGGCVKKLPELVPILRRMGILRIGRIGMAYSILAPARELIAAMSEILKKNPTLNLCDDILCLWCRELERRMNLYKKIQNPKYFQKNILIIKIIALINKFRLKNHGLLSFQGGKGDEVRERGRLKACKDILLYNLRIVYLIFRERLNI